MEAIREQARAIFDAALAAADPYQSVAKYLDGLIRVDCL
jgi:hypothetical protein